ncbi:MULTISPECIES: hypothetical protein [Pseudomonas]|uniref:Uncharacterized protein n=1 Tax=Pseudomonas putida TaxID=303 RepID=A0AAW6PW93_PSEPU|nr:MULTISPECIES: hypothetical protein [Pseudomonas]MBH3469060.1 hypothetical protein [Pseudomonas putida]MCE0778708.1 hypothetical protein [Pseudomonas sp. NMI542_15]MDF3873800.1 hypothetical protein [Pseudomonas putida]MDF3880079.1 hypothetical protein [Pseudomonas putida]GLO06568.1 hypothetical protein PPUJ20005_05360 [Pseudomonas putida]
MHEIHLHTRKHCNARKLTIVFLATTLGSQAFAVTQAITYAIENPLRPGAKAAHCPSQAQVIDGCTFHSVAGDMREIKRNVVAT